MRKTINDGYCLICKNEYGLEPHEPYRGRNRKLSIKYGLVITLCHSCHEVITLNPFCKTDIMTREYVKSIFEYMYPDLDFKEVFK